MDKIHLNEAYWKSAEDITLLEDSNIGNFFDWQVGKAINDVAVVYSSYETLGIQGISWTYLEYQQNVNELAKALLGSGFSKGDHVAVWSINIPEWLILQLACAKLGVVLVTMNPALRSEEAKYVLEKSDASAVFLLSNFSNRNYVEELMEFENELPYLQTIYTFNDYDDEKVISYRQLLAKGTVVTDQALTNRQSSITCQEIFQIQYTSGTTGFPKGVMLTHRNALNNARFLFNRWGVTAENVVFTPLPFFHTAGSILMALASITTGSTFITQPYFMPEDAVDLMKKNKETHFGGVPTMLQGVLQVLENTGDKVELKSFMSGGSPVPRALIERLEQKTNSKGTVLMGMTETGGIFSATSPNDPAEKRYLTSGKPLPHIDIKVVHPENHTIQPCNMEGEIEVRGYSVMKGYYRMKGQTEQVLDQDGWLKTGDIGYLDSEGYIYVIGRLKDMIIRGGENIYPREIEDYLMTHTKISQAQVVAVPDEYYGEVPVAFVIVKEGEQLNEKDVIQYCKGKISHQKTPTAVLFLDAFPLTASGKIQKNVLRENFLENIQIGGK